MGIGLGHLSCLQSRISEILATEFTEGKEHPLCVAEMIAVLKSLIYSLETGGIEDGCLTKEQLDKTDFLAQLLIDAKYRRVG